MTPLLIARAPRVCGDDPEDFRNAVTYIGVLPAYAGRIPLEANSNQLVTPCSPRMRG